MRGSWFGSRLALKLIVGLTLFSSVITAILTGIQLYAEYNRDVSGLEQRIGEIKQSYAGGLVTSLWLDDSLMVQRQLQGIQSLPDIVFAEVRDREGNVSAVGTPASDLIG